MTWELFFGLGALALAIVLAWGMLRNRQRNRANDPITEAATRREYDNPTAYGTEQERFKAAAKD
jgi:hypothetical protein